MRCGRPARGWNAVRREIVAAVAGKSEAELMACPAGGGWCAAEVLDHLRTAEGSLVRALRKFERGEPTRVPRRAWYYRLPMIPVFWPIKLTAPKLVRPRPRAEVNPAEVLESLATSRRELFALVDRMGEERFAASFSRIFFSAASRASRGSGSSPGTRANISSSSAARSRPRKSAARPLSSGPPNARRGPSERWESCAAGFSRRARGSSCRCRRGRGSSTR